MTPRLLSGGFPLGLFVLPVTFTFYIFAVIKRLRDIDASPWWALIAWVPILNIPLLLIPGSKDKNRYGVAPKKYTSSELFFAIFLPLALVGLMSATVIPEFQKNYEYYLQQAEERKGS